MCKTFAGVIANLLFKKLKIKNKVVIWLSSAEEMGGRLARDGTELFHRGGTKA
jgi:hypothetical protein